MALADTEAILNSSPENSLKKGSPVVLVLEDGAYFTGTLFGDPHALCSTQGEVVFCTTMEGYQQVCTDPSYRGQIVVFTYPMIGNYGVSPDASESSEIFLSGIVVSEACDEPSHWESTQTIHEWFAANHVVGIEGADTRDLTRHLRDCGTKRGLVVPYDPSLTHAKLKWWVQTEVRPRAEQVLAISESDLVSEVSRREPEIRSDVANKRGRVVVVDTGVKSNIIRCLEAVGLAVTIVPYSVNKEMLAACGEYDGILLANGPGDPESLPELTELVRGLIPSGVPIMGICLGHQILGLAIDASTSRLPFGHHGANHPVQGSDGRVSITSQNHNFQVDAGSISPESGFRVTSINLTDRSVEGMESTTYPVFSVQYHPEACPGPEDNMVLFEKFATMVENAKSAKEPVISRSKHSRRR